MFFDFSQKKILPLSLITLILSVSVASFVFANRQFQIVDEGENFVARTQANFFYDLFYKGSSGPNPPMLPKLASAIRNFKISDFSNFFASLADNTLNGNSTLAATIQSSAAPVVAAKNLSGSADAVPVLIYHGTPAEGNNNVPLPQKVFVEQMHALKDAGWQTITLKDFSAFMKGEKILPAKSFLLTFDDARKESFYPADPVLKDLGYTAVMFVITGFSLPEEETNSTFYLSKNELKYMKDSGRWELESHGDEDHRLYNVPGIISINGVLPTISDEHFLSNKFWLQSQGRVETTEEFRNRVAEDLWVSKAKLEKAFGKPITAFAYPFNEYGQNSVNFPESIDILSEVVKDYYTFAFYQVEKRREDFFNYPNPKEYRIKRLEPLASWDGQYLVKLLETAAPKNLPYHADQFKEEWVGNWGTVTFENGNLNLKARQDTTGSTALLTGSVLWENYALKTRVDWKTGSHISLVARYQNDSSAFLSCAFSENSITLKTHNHGTLETLAAIPYEFSGNKHDTELSMTVNGDRASCSIEGKTLRVNVPKSFVHGGSLGLQIWDAQVGVAEATVHEVSANAL